MTMRTPTRFGLIIAVALGVTASGTSWAQNSGNTTAPQMPGPVQPKPSGIAPAPPVGPVLSFEEIRDVQRALKAEGFDPGPIDGFIGPRTRQAVTEFQRAHGLEATGRLTAPTLGALDVDVDRASVSSSPSALPSDNQPGLKEPGVNRYESGVRGKQS